MQQSTKVWDEIFKNKGKVFAEPHENIPDVCQELKIRKANNVLDLGCGSGRHIVYLAKNGFSVFGLDNSPEGLAIANKWLNEEGVSADLQLHDMIAPLPYETDFFDAVISVQVIHHGKMATIRKVIKEIERVLKKGGYIFITVPKLQNQGKNFQQIEANTFIPLDGPEKGLPHHYFTPKELKELFENFEVKDIHLDDTQHYCLSGVRL
jgi:cyclopropane fatty-acyl-phospholipid synthase-like methyltransferase